MNAQLMAVALEQVEKRPDPRLPVVDLVKNVFRNNPEKVFSASEVSAIVRSVRSDVNPKYIGSMLSKLCRFPNAFLANSGRGLYRLTKAEKIKVAPAPEVGTVPLFAELEKLKDKAVKRLAILRGQREELEKQVIIINNEIRQLENLFD